VPSVDKAKLLTQTLDRLHARLKPAAIPALGDDAAPPEPGPEGAGPDIFHADPVLREFVRSFLVWECTTARADAAMKKIASAVVDVNEFRVCLPGEMAAIIGVTYPRVEDRVLALRAALNNLFKRENRLRMAHLPTLSKKQASAFLAAVSTNHFAADRVALLCCGIHALPVDSRIAAVLEKAKVIEKGSTPADAAGAATRLLKAGEARDAYAILQAAADQAPVTPTRAPKPTPTKPAGPKRAARAGARKSK